MLKQTSFIFAASLMTSAYAADISSVDCTPPKIIVTFDAAVNDYNSGDATSGLTSLKFKRNVSTTSDVVVLEPLSGTWNSNRDTFTIRPTRQNYEDTYSWNAWPLAVETTADGDTDSQACN